MNINTEIEIEADLNTKSDQAVRPCIAAIAGFVFFCTFQLVSTQSNCEKTVVSAEIRLGAIEIDCTFTHLFIFHFL